MLDIKEENSKEPQEEDEELNNMHKLHYNIFKQNKKNIK